MLFNIKVFFRLLYKNKFKLVFFPLLSVGIAFCICIFLPKKYFSNVMVYPSSSGRNANLSAVGSILGQSIGGSNVKEEILIHLESRSFLMEFIDSRNLLPHIYYELWNSQTNSWKGGIEPSLISAASYFKSNVLMVSNDEANSLLSIGIKFHDPNLASEIANNLVEDLKKYLFQKKYADKLDFNLYLNNQMKLNQKRYFEASKQVKYYYKNQDTPRSGSLVDVLIGDNFEAHIISSEAIDTAGVPLKNDNYTLVKNLPEDIYLDHLIFEKEIVQEVLKALNQQYESSNLDLANIDKPYKIIDSAIPSNSPHFPRTKVILLLTFLLSLIITTMGIILIELDSREGKYEK